MSPASTLTLELRVFVEHVQTPLHAAGDASRILWVLVTYTVSVFLPEAINLTRDSHPAPLHEQQLSWANLA